MALATPSIILCPTPAIVPPITALAFALTSVPLPSGVTSSALHPGPIPDRPCLLRAGDSWRTVVYRNFDAAGVIPLTDGTPSFT